MLAHARSSACTAARARKWAYAGVDALVEAFRAAKRAMASCIVSYTPVNGILMFDWSYQKILQHTPHVRRELHLRSA
eukprot:6186112-Pleurochrysis_carterae.AAC.5